MKIFELTSPHGVPTGLDSATTKYWIDVRNKILYPVLDKDDDDENIFHWYYVLKYPQVFGIDPTQKNDVFKIAGEPHSLDEYIKYYKDRYETIPDYPISNLMILFKQCGFVRCYVDSSITLQAASLRDAHIAIKLIVREGPSEETLHKIYISSPDIGRERKLVDDDAEFFIKYGRLPINEDINRADEPYPYANKVSSEYYRYWVDLNTNTVYAFEEEFHWYFVVNHPDLFGIDGNDPHNGYFSTFEYGDCTARDYRQYYRDGPYHMPDYPEQQMHELLMKGYARVYITASNNKIIMQTGDMRQAYKTTGVLSRNGYDFMPETELTIETIKPKENVKIGSRRLDMFLRTGRVSDSRMLESKR